MVSKTTTLNKKAALKELCTCHIGRLPNNTPIDDDSLMPEMRIHGSGCALRNPWSRKPLAPSAKSVHIVDLVGYTRSDLDGIGADEQLKRLQNFCSKHGYRIKKVFADIGKPSFGLQAALEALDDADGLIVFNLNRLVEHSKDRLRDLRPLIRCHFFDPAKHLITIEDGIDTSSPTGQASLIELINRSKDFA